MSGIETVPSRETGENYGGGTGLLDPRVMREVYGTAPLAAPELPQNVQQTYQPVETQTQPVSYDNRPIGNTPVATGAIQEFDWRSHFPVQATQQYDPRFNTSPGNGEVYYDENTCGVDRTGYQGQRYDARYLNELAWQNACNQGRQQRSSCNGGGNWQQQQWQQQQWLQQQRQQAQWQQQQWQQQHRYSNNWQQQQQWEQQQRQQQAWQQQQWQQQHRNPNWQQQQWQQQQWEQQQRQQAWQQQQWEQQQYGNWNQQQQYWDQQQRHYDQQRYWDQVNYGQRYNNGCNNGGFNGRQHYDNNVGRQLTNAGIAIGTNLLLNQINGGRGGCYGGGGFNGGWNQGYNGGWNQGYNRGYNGGWNGGWNGGRGNQAAAIINTIQAFSGGGRGYRGCR